MRPSPQLCKQHIGWHLKKLWLAKRALKVTDTGVEKKLAERGIQVVQPDEIIKEKRLVEKFDIVGLAPKPQLLDQSHPNWHDKTLLTYKDNNVLLEGLAQAKLLTNTVEIKDGLPDFILTSSKSIDGRIKEIILSAHVFDSEQKKLPKIKDPNRPAWNFPRVYGITQERSTKLLLMNLLQLIENKADLSLVKQRYLVDDALFTYSFERGGQFIQFELKGDRVLTSLNPLDAVTEEETGGFDLPDIFPIKPTITLNEENIYEVRGIYPISLKFGRSHPHTVFVHHNETDVQNVYEEPVTENQIFGRSLLKTFTVAASYAKEKYGSKVVKLPKPVAVQCVHTNGRLFHFGVLQLNTLDLEGGDIKNVWYQSGRIPLFESCCYKNGRPVLEGYNNEVVKYLEAFYNKT